MSIYTHCKWLVEDIRALETAHFPSDLSPIFPTSDPCEAKLRARSKYLLVRVLCVADSFPCFRTARLIHQNLPDYEPCGAITPATVSKSSCRSFSY